MLKRAISGLIFVIVLISAILYSNTTAFGLFLFLMLIAIYEFHKMLDTKNILLYLIGISSYLSSEGSIHTFEKLGFYSKYFQTILATNSITYSLLFLLLLQVLFNKNEKNPIKTLSKYSLTYLYTVIPFGILITIPYVNNNHQYAGSTLLACLILIWSTDTFAYLTGRAIGKNKLFERISPNKTIEGSIGGTLFTFIAAYILSIYFTQYNLYQWLGLSILISIVGSLGDLVESMFKRAVNIKDSGKLIPGHGGVLDRFDSLIYATPFIYLYLQLIS